MKQNKFIFTDEELRGAAIILRQRILDSLPAPEECFCEISLDLRRKINKIVAKDRRRVALRKVRNQAAMIALSILLGLGAWLTIDTEARAAFFQWVREVYEESVLYRYFNSPKDENAVDVLPIYTITLPEGYQETASMGDDNMWLSIYDGEAGTIMLSYQRIHEGTQLEIHSGDYLYSDVQLEKFSADFYEAINPGETNELVWVDEREGITFSISATLSKGAMIELANGVREK